jgi:plastocyanin
VRCPSSPALTKALDPPSSPPARPTPAATAAPRVDLGQIWGRTFAGQPIETISFRATTDGAYRYECPVPGHAAMGMQGTFEVNG